MQPMTLLVMLIVISVSKCLAMSVDEIEEFKSYLRRTSQFDQNLKKGETPDDDEVDESVSDHAWEESGKFEGDLILNDRQRRFIVENVAEGLSRNGLNDGTKRWPNNEVVYFIQREHFTKDQVQAIKGGIDDLARASCVTFRPYKRGDRDAVVIQGSRKGCFSQVGYQGGYQVLNLSGRHPVGRGCFRHGTVVHELLHTLGFYHMQSSPDRDDYVDVMWENIIEPARHNFRKYNSFAVTDFGVGYDYDSVLHYSRRAFSSNGQDTLVPKQSGVTIGQRIGLSDKDTQKLNKMYCDANSDIQSTDDGPALKPKKNKNPKNKPFDGHGLGYHKGKTVVIKLLPTPETYKLSDMPSSHIFDYFSKTPQILPSSQIEGLRIGTKIRNSPNEFKEYSTSRNLQDHNKYINPEISHHSTRDNRQNNNESEYMLKDDYKNSQTSSHEPSSDTKRVTSSQPKDDLNKIYYRFHMYPSPSSNEKLIGSDEDYSDFYVPSNLKPVKNIIENPYETRKSSDPQAASSPRNTDEYFHY